MTDTTQQRINMVDTQVRPSDVTDRRIIRAMLELPREAFAPPAFRSLAYMDEPLPVTEPGNGPLRTLLAPRTLAKLVQLAEIEADHSVLDVGCGSGYSSALLARLAGKVAAIECDAGLAERATRQLQALGIENVDVLQGQLGDGIPAAAPFDAILLNGAVPEAPQALLDQLKDGGRLVAVIAARGFGQARVWRRSGNAFASRAAFDAAADPLPGFARQPGFAL
jgi:protein-L-isoaspartate(D-aspartate) O-methyltransferase